LAGDGLAGDAVLGVIGDENVGVVDVSGELVRGEYDQVAWNGAAADGRVVP